MAAILQDAQDRKNSVLSATLDHASSSIKTLAITMRERVRKAPSYYHYLVLQTVTVGCW